MDKSPFESINTRTMRQDRVEEAISAFWAYALCAFIGLCITFAVAATWQQMDFHNEEIRDE